MFGYLGPASFLGAKYILRIQILKKKIVMGLDLNPNTNWISLNRKYLTCKTHNPLKIANINLPVAS